MKPDISLIKKVLSLPTAPFHEGLVSRFVRDFCKRLGLPIQQDNFGNLKVIYRRGTNPPRYAVTAHMDHPGFEVIRGGAKGVVQLLGGVPDKFFRKAKVIVCQDGRQIKGRVAGVANAKKRRYFVKGNRPIEKNAFGYFDLPSVRIKNGLIQTKAADDLINVALLLNLLKELVRRKTKAHLLCVFTRAEEVGFIGALGIAKREWISKKIPLLVLEASSAKAGKVTIGGGPVLRVGDRASTFSHAVDLWLQETAKGFPLRRGSGLAFQRALLSGGRCEATVYVEKGYLSGCLALPLGNYHNRGAKNYAMEYISLSDYANLLRWLFILARSKASPKQIPQKREKELDMLFEKFADRLKEPNLKIKSKR